MKREMIVLLILVAMATMAFSQEVRFASGTMDYFNVHEIMDSSDNELLETDGHAMFSSDTVIVGMKSRKKGRTWTFNLDPTYEMRLPEMQDDGFYYVAYEFVTYNKKSITCSNSTTTIGYKKINIL